MPGQHEEMEPEVRAALDKAIFAETPEPFWKNVAAPRFTVEQILRNYVHSDFWDTPEMAQTPIRWANMMHELTDRGSEDFNFTLFDKPEGADEMVIVDNIPFVTLCSHHLIPFVGVCHIGYVPGSKIAGLSKFARTVKYFAKGTWNQEALTHKIASELQLRLTDPVGVAVVMQAEHMCMTLRGVQVPGTLTTTSAMLGCFADHSKQARNEFLQLIRRK